MVFYVEQVASAVAVGAAETVDGFAFLAYGFGGVTFFGFVGLFVEHFDCFCCFAA